MIKNRDSRISRACSYISGTHRWFLTGTPVQNSTDELFPVLRFLMTKRSELLKFKQFRGLYGVNRDTSKHSTNMTRLRTVNRDITLARKGTDTLMGKAILEVPVPHPTELEAVELRLYEREIWDNVVNPDRKSKKNAFELCSQMRKAAAHFGMVEPNPLPLDGLGVKEDFPKDSIERFCRICCRVLLGPVIAVVSKW
jgi:SNF2 family DNA or RNA helicase